MTAPLTGSWAGVSPTAANLDGTTHGSGTTAERNAISSWPATRPFWDTDLLKWYNNTHVSAPSSVTWTVMSDNNPASTRTRQVATRSSSFSTTSTSFVNAGLSLTLANITGGKAIVTASLTVYNTGAAGSVAAQILKGASTVIDKQQSQSSSANEFGQIHLSAVVDLDGEIVKVQILKNGGTTAFLYFHASFATPKLELLEFSG